MAGDATYHFRQGTLVVPFNQIEVGLTLHRIAHVNQIHRLAWQPALGIASELASCSEDGTLKILKIPITG